MTSLASPVHGETALTSSLIAFYATVATVIPVLFLALAVQSGTVQWLAVNYWRRPSELPYVKNLLALPAALRFIVLFTAGLGQFVLLGVFFLILAGGIVGEFFSLDALSSGTDRSGSRSQVLFLVSFLIIMVAAGPALAFVRVAIEMRLSRHKAVVLAATTAELDKTDAEQDQQPDWPQLPG